MMIVMMMAAIAVHVPVRMKKLWMRVRGIRVRCGAEASAERNGVAHSRSDKHSMRWPERRARLQQRRLGRVTGLGPGLSVEKSLSRKHVERAETVPRRHRC